MEEKEIWKDIEEYEGLYQISSFGNTMSIARNGTKGGIIKPITDKNGYLKVNLYKNNKMKTFRVNILVAQAFIPNPLNLPQVNHKKEFEKTNNKADNLEWVSSKQNANYGTRNERISKSKMVKVYQYTTEGLFVRDYNSLKEASEINRCNYTHISSCCSGKLKKAYGYKWSYIRLN